MGVVNNAEVFGQSGKGVGFQFGPGMSCQAASAEIRQRGDLQLVALKNRPEYAHVELGVVGRKRKAADKGLYVAFP